MTDTTASHASRRFAPPLPIDDALAPLADALTRGSKAVLIAPPGAGKTTRVPLALDGAAWLAGRKILLLEPRRLAARGAARRMAATLGEEVGETVGLRARLETKVSRKTRIEVLTEGVFTRMILDDPTLDGIGAVLFDEFHERSLDADLGLALALDAQGSVRDDLRLLVMSATLAGNRVSELLGGAPVISSEGRSYPVETRYLGKNPALRLEDRMADAIQRALRADTGSILAFLPGQGEIRRTEERLRERIDPGAAILAPLYGALDRREQDLAISPAPSGQRKIVLATAIAETSLTIEGVRVVVDCGTSRVPRFDPDVGVTRLETVRVSRASADQRRGRAGRMEPGVCYRLWDEAETASLPAFSEPEIRAADLAPLVLDCAEWGVTDPRTLAWLDPPTTSALDAAREELAALGAIDDAGRLTETGRRLRSLPLPPRLAAMLIAAADIGAENEAAEIAAVLVERGIGGNDTSLDHRLELFRRDRSRRATDMRRMAEGWARTARSGSPPPGGEGLGVGGRPPSAVLQSPPPGLPHKGGGDVKREGGGNDHAHPHARARTRRGDDVSTAALLALAYPERIAKARGARGQFLLANGRGAHVDAADGLARAPFLVVAELQGSAAATRIILAAPTTEAEVLAFAGTRVTNRDEIAFDRPTASVRVRRTRRLDALELASEPRAADPSPDVEAAFVAGLTALGSARLPWSKTQLQLRDRVAFLSAAGSGDWPDLSDAALTGTLGEWLGPFLSGKTRLDEIDAEDLGAALDALVPWTLKRRLEDEAPTHFEAPTGNRHAIDYEGAGAPALHIRVQELFGLKAHPAIAGGKLPLTLNLLSPAHRPIQITRDLPGFWSGSWAAVKADMKGRYPRHPWPDDPANAPPTARAKPRGT
ncbi:MAG: ATP-dependent helicase HrpB [Hyphomicrobium sp.]|jgi:ATP-dependent helicase HrpB|uniref:ATP-dependent helicase HrpB n=2 Tax=Hyphomicrobium TaxID=81 RepID=UPI0025C58F12|nr:ATP-dependent helicase HrpB [Hyphomicrobium sp.]MBX9863344.1 ATP-dependent helicase HrpB [Hyphomicrobium sp.]